MDEYKNIVIDISGQIGTIRINRPETLNALSEDVIIELTSAFHLLDENPETVLTVLTGTGRFFSSGADVRSTKIMSYNEPELGKFLSKSSQKRIHDVKEKIKYMTHLVPHVEMLRSIINHRKVFILALNGPAIGGGAAWFTGVADIVFASSNCFLQVPFSTLGLIPELGSAPIFSQSMGVHRANEFLMFDRRLDARELEASGILNRIFPEQDFQKSVTQYLSDILIASDGQSLMEAKRLMCEPLKEKRMVAVMNSIDALAKRFATGSPQLRFKKKTEELEAKSKSRFSKL